MKTDRLSFWIALFSLSSLPWATAAQNNPTTLDASYLAALRSGEVRQLRAALDNGASPNARDTAGSTPLMHAAVYGDLSCLKLLLKEGAEVNATNAAGATALMRAAYDYDKVRLLLEQGADVQIRSALGNTALILAARPAQSTRTVELLLKSGARATDANQFGGTALMAAVASGNEKSARLLIKGGAEVNAQPAPNEGGFLLGGGRTALMWAAYRGDVAMTQLLLDHGADANAISGLGTALGHAAWGNHSGTARLLIERGAKVNQAGPKDGYTPLHWAASSEEKDTALVKLLLSHGADPRAGGGENVDAFRGTLQTPLMLARRRGETDIVAQLLAAGGTNATPDPVTKTKPERAIQQVDVETLHAAVGRAVPLLQETSLKSRENFISHESAQGCTSCHQQYLPMAAIGLARQFSVEVDRSAEERLVKMVKQGELQNPEVDWQPVFHPDPSFTKGYELFALAAQNLGADETSDAWVHHLSALQGVDGQWFNNLPRPPIQSGDIAATALAVHALQRYPLPGRKAQLAKQVARARQWLRRAQSNSNEGHVYQLLGLSWAGEPAAKLEGFSKALLAEQRADGGWAQLPGLDTDAYATAQAIYALRVGGGLEDSHPAIEQGRRYLLRTQLDDGTWHVRRRAFPFQPTMKAAFPHGRDAWISSAATSWAVMALSLPERTQRTVDRRSVSFIAADQR